MNQLRAWLYGHDAHSPFAKKSMDESSNSFSTHVPKDDTEAAMEGSLRRSITKVIPLQPGDCLECKLVGTAVMMASGFFVFGSAITAKQRNPNLKQFHGGLYTLLCGGLVLGFEFTALCRLMDWGPFKRP